MKQNTHNLDTMLVMILWTLKNKKGKEFNQDFKIAVIKIITL